MNLAKKHSKGKGSWNLSRRRAGLIFKILGLALIISAAVYFAGDIKDVFASNGGGGSKSKKEKKSKNKTTGQVMSVPASTEVTVLKKWGLPKALTEISGLSYLDNDRFACVQDELGTIFIYNTATSSVEKEISFGPAGDYEGLAIVNDNVWVLRSDGRLFEVNNIHAAKPQVKEYATKLTAQQDTEGLCYDKDNNRLLLAVKDEGSGATNSYKGIYSFDLATNEMPSAPVFKIDLNNEAFNGVDQKKNKSGGMMPSGIAIHPITRDIYITEGRKAKLLVTDAKGVIKKLYQLDKSHFEQPEGITIKPSGDIYISNEGVKQEGNIVSVSIDLENNEKAMK